MEKKRKKRKKKEGSKKANKQRFAYEFHRGRIKGERSERLRKSPGRRESSNVERTGGGRRETRDKKEEKLGTSRTFLGSI